MRIVMLTTLVLILAGYLAVGTFLGYKADSGTCRLLDERFPRPRPTSFHTNACGRRRRQPDSGHL